MCSLQKEEIDSEDDKTPEEKLTGEITGTIPQGTDNTSEVLDSALKGLSARDIQHCSSGRNQGEDYNSPLSFDKLTHDLVSDS
uniref:Uncharacterized protein n=1 Tax=Timema tahoe TaxID=61484 RepID=A0A7R9P0N6_9NEOP|nr:unnamed protein product [Timema tahoe]